MKPWPSSSGRQQQQQQQQDKQKKNRSDDSEWNVEHGDSVPPVLFRMARLSQEYPTEEQLRIFNDPKSSRMKSLQSTDITLDETDVPRALIERCWERAVHAASNAMVAPVATKTTSVGAGASTTNHGPNHQHRSSQFDINTPLSQESCQIKCESLGIDIESQRADAVSTEAARSATTSSSSTSSSTTCPRCTRSFQTSEELLCHYYGNVEKRGCCRALVRPRHLELVRNLLQHHVQSQTDQLLNVVMSQAATDQDKNDNNDDDIDDDSADASTNSSDEEPKTARTKRKQQLILGWKDVRYFLKSTLEDSASIPIEASTTYRRTEARHPVQQSLQTTTTSGNDESTSTTQPPPLMLNPMILEAVNRRLIDRYADVPR